MTHGYAAIAPDAGSHQKVETAGSTSLMGGGAQAIIYSIMSAILQTYSRIRSLNAELGQALVRAQSAETKMSAEATKQAAYSQAYQMITQAVQSFGSFCMSAVQAGLNRLSPSMQKLQEEHDKLGSITSQQKTLLELTDKPAPSLNAQVGTANAPAATNPNQAAILSAKTDLMRNLGAQSGRDTTHDEAAIGLMHENGGTDLTRFRADLKEAIKHNETLMTEKTQQITNERQQREVVSQAVNGFIQATSNGVQSGYKSAQGQHEAAKTIADYVAQSSAASLQTFADAFRHYFDAVSSLIQQASAAARANPQ